MTRLRPGRRTGPGDIRSTGTANPGRGPAEPAQETPTPPEAALFPSPDERQLEAVIRRQLAPISDFIREHCAAQLRHRPESLKRLVISLVRKEIPPTPSRSGRPPKAEITKARTMKAEQLKEINQGRRAHVDWHQIASASIPGYKEMRFEWQRNQARKRLNNSVFARDRTPPAEAPLN